MHLGNIYIYAYTQICIRKNIKSKYIKILTGVVFSVEFQVTSTFFFILPAFSEISQQVFFLCSN